MIYLLPFIFLILVGCDYVEKMFVEEDLLDRPPSKRCGECHQKIYNQWMHSRHSVSWTSGEFVRSSKNRTKKKCLSCHAPLEVLPEKQPVVREKLREEGVNCFSCHYREETGSIHGPYEVFSPPHYSTYDPDYISSKICAGCHRKTYSQWKASGSDRTCQNCHMPSKKDRLIQKFPFMYLHSKKELHNHRFPALKADRKDMELSLEEKDGMVILRVKNTGIPHRFPAAQQGNPRVYITLKGISGGNEVYTETVMLTAKTGIDYMKTKEFYFFPDVKTERFSVIVERKLSYQEKREVLFTADFPD
ncbi:multiheme c-type cytochrome [Persephonella sp.]